MAKYKIHYRGCDGSDTTNFSTLGQVARYVKGRDLGSCYRRPSGLQGEYAFFSFEGFSWADLLDKPFTAEGAKYKPELLADIKLRTVERKYDNREFIARWWDVKDGPEKAGTIELRARPIDPDKPFVPFLGDSHRNSGPAVATLEEAKAWVVAEYTKAESPPAPLPVDDGPDW